MSDTAERARPGDVLRAIADTMHKSVDFMDDVELIQDAIVDARVLNEAADKLDALAAEVDKYKNALRYLGIKDLARVTGDPG